MNIKPSPDERLVMEMRKIAVERETLERSFKHFRFKVGKQTWDRPDLHDRAICRFAKQKGGPIH